MATDELTPEMKQMKAIAAGTQVLTPAATSGKGPDPNSPDYPADFYRVQWPRWDLVNDVRAGTDAIRAAKEKYMPKGAVEEGMDYDRRIAVAPFFNAYKRTLRGLTGIAMGKPFRLPKESHPLIVADWEDIDLAGNKAPVFISNTFEDGLHYGHVGILVDYPSIQGTPNAVEERARNLRPYWVRITPDQILNATWYQRNGRTILQQVTLVFEVRVPTGRYGTSCQKEFRVYWVDGEVVYWSAYRYTTNASGVKVLGLTGSGIIANQTEIPLALGYFGDIEGPLQTRPTLYELAHTNLDHYRVQADHRHSLHKASIPILVFKNRVKVDSSVAVNPDVGIDVQGEHGDVYYREHSGSALGQTRTEIQDIESRMAAQGLAMLQRQVRLAETATANQLDKAEQYSTLSDAVGTMRDMVEQAMRFHANYRKVPAPTIEANTSFEALSMDPAMIAVLSQMEVAGQLTLDSLWVMLQRAGILPDSFDAVIEMAKLLKAGKQTPPGLPLADGTGEEVPPGNDGKPAGGTGA